MQLSIFSGSRSDSGVALALLSWIIVMAVLLLRAIRRAEADAIATV